MSSGARLDWYEQGDTWSRVAANRPPDTDTPPADSLTAGVRRLMTADTGPASPLVVAGPLAHAAAWLHDFHHAGEHLAELHHGGALTRGLRSLLAHHILFHCNRMGIPYATQATIAAAAKTAVLGGPDDDGPTERTPGV